MSIAVAPAQRINAKNANVSRIASKIGSNMISPFLRIRKKGNNQSIPLHHINNPNTEKNTRKEK